MDYLIFQKINQFAGKWQWLDALGVFFAEYLGYALILILILFLLTRAITKGGDEATASLTKDLKRYWQMALGAIMAAVLARFGIVELIRFFWYRPRPWVENNVNLLLPHDPESSFPSGHAAFYFGLSAMVYFYNKKAGILFFAASFLISIARVFSGVHWPSDILAGAVVGVLSGWLIFFCFRNFSQLRGKNNNNKSDY